MECEQERRSVESTKNRMHEELLSNMARRKAREIFEMERQRKIEEMIRLTETVSAESIAMAETNDRLSHVHEDLKNAFKRMRVSRCSNNWISPIRFTVKRYPIDFINDFIVSWFHIKFHCVS